MTILASYWQEIGRSNWGGIETGIVYAYSEENVAGNYSIVHTKFVLNLTQYLSASSWSLGLDGTGGTSGGYTTWSAGDHELISGSWTVPHNADGTGDVTIHANWSSTYGLTSWTPSLYVGLPTIPRASQPSTSTGTLECNGSNKITINTNRASTAFTHTLTYSFEGTSGSIATGVTDSYEWTVPTSLLSAMTTKYSGTVTVTCKTFNGSTQIGSDKTCTFTLTCTTAVPTISASIAEKNTTVGTSSTYTVIGISNKLVTATVSTKLSATVSKVVLTVAGKDYTMTGSGATYTYTINASQSGTYKVTITDSRGLTASASYAQTEYAYYAPYSTDKSLVRSPNTTSSTGILTITGKWFSSLSNTLTATGTIKNSTASSATAITVSLTKSGDTFTITAGTSVLTMLTYTESFIATVKLTDKFGTNVVITATLAASEYVAWEGKNTFCIKGTLIINGQPVDYNMPAVAIAPANIASNTGSYSSMFPYKYDISIAWVTAATDVTIYPASETDFNNLDGCYNGSWSTLAGIVRLYFLKKPSATVNVIVGV